ncbi:hypothetical protein K504DRAFT_452988 [Pleomassaria siparia CBS 279.74]|uniref:RING-type domain-containing protein n=1 Tax=Pleomassaria siparia CBS 279.74 TaxID=1314801 RepID=A0A6G1JQ66_9PLEO|nr:hypothetical protein K504DRAFT_452988 [Pleomassaria siparia CBS 279.74]
MPYRIPEPILSNFLTHYTVPVSLSSLSQSSSPSSCPTCPICTNPYASPPRAYTHPLLPPDTPEYAVQVVNRGPCTHIFGRSCIEKHMRARMPWSHSCPMCRAEWFPAPHAARGQMMASVERALSIMAQVEIGGVGTESADALAEVEILLERVREGLYGNRWV